MLSPNSSRNDQCLWPRQHRWTKFTGLCIRWGCELWPQRKRSETWSQGQKQAWGISWERRKKETNENTESQELFSNDRQYICLPTKCHKKLWVLRGGSKRAGFGSQQKPEGEALPTQTAVGKEEALGSEIRVAGVQEQLSSVTSQVWHH